MPARLSPYGCRGPRFRVFTATRKCLQTNAPANRITAPTMISAKAGSSALRLILRPRPAGSSVSADLVGAGSGTRRRPRLVVVLDAQTTTATTTLLPLPIEGITLSCNHQPTHPYSFTLIPSSHKTHKTPHHRSC